MVRYLIVEDEPSVSSFLAEVAEQLGGAVHLASNLKEARQVIDTYRIDIVLLDLMLPDGDGLELLPHIKSTLPEAIVIVITSVYETKTIVRAIKEGASEYITKPVELAYLKKLLGNYQELVSLKRQRLSGAVDLDAIVGESPATEAIKKTIIEVASYSSTVLITGPTGVGKNLIAGVIHSQSPRAKGPFVVFDCTTVPEHLVEAELFGYVRGAFTGADRTKEGLVSEADGGTLFIDEICELPLHLQPKLLRL
ncbi:MAG: sigma-54-dependent Fis family transcriptional regulator, partial [Nitrospirae bacterium]